MPDLTIDTPSVAPLAPVAALCDVDGCQEPAQFSYLWDWGQTGLCCAHHALILRQKSGNLNRTVTIQSLVAPAPTAMTRDERIRMRAEVMTIQEDVAELKQRNLELYNANQELTRELRRMGTELSQLQDMLADARAEADQLTADKMTALADLGTRTAELVRLEAVLHAADTRPE